jgi:HK97 family phage major capsid protein
VSTAETHNRTPKRGEKENVMPLKVKELREESARLFTEAQAVLDAAEADNNRELKPEEKSENDKRFNRMKQIKSLLDENTRFAELHITGGKGADDKTPPGNITTPKEPEGRQEFSEGEGREYFTSKPGEKDDAGYRRHVDAINRFIRTGETRGPKFTLTTGSGSSILLPTAVARPVVIKRIKNPIRAALMARGLIAMATVGTGAIAVPVFDDTANEASVIAQDNTSENNLDPTVTGLTLGNDLYDSGTVWSSNTLLNSLDFDLLAYLQPMLEARIDAKQETAWFDDLDAATVGKTTATTTGVTYAELLDWQHSIPVARRGDGVFFVSDGLMRALRGLVDANDNPIYQPSLRDDMPDTLLGWPIFITGDLATPAAGAVSGVAASAEALIIRDITGADGGKRIARYTNIPTHPDQFGLRMFANGDFAFVPGSVKTLKHAAS